MFCLSIPRVRRRTKRIQQNHSLSEWPPCSWEQRRVESQSRITAVAQVMNNRGWSSGPIKASSYGHSLQGSPGELRVVHTFAWCRGDRNWCCDNFQVVKPSSQQAWWKTAVWGIGQWWSWHRHYPAVSWLHQSAESHQRNANYITALAV